MSTLPAAVRKKKLLFFSAVIALISVTAASHCSFLYPMNTWVDVNCFRTVGSGILHGLVPYRDLCEQKGPLLYYIYALAAFVTPKSFFGVYLLELLAMTAFFYYSLRTALLYVPEREALFLLPLNMALTVFTAAFVVGGSSEEFCLPFLMCSLYRMLRTAREGRMPSAGEAALIGAMAAWIFWIKFSMIGFFAGLCLWVLIVGIRDKRLRELWLSIGGFLLGFLLLSLAVLAYMAANSALTDLFTVYFYDNIFVYSTLAYDIVPFKPLNSVLCMGAAVAKWFYRSPHMACATVMSVLFALSRRENARQTRRLRLFRREVLIALDDESLVVLLGGGLLFVSSYAGGIGFHYYQLAFAPFTVLGLVWLAQTLKARSPGVYSRCLDRLGLVSGCIVLLCCCVNLLFGTGRGRLLKPREELAQYRFGEIINSKSDPTLLNYGFLDGGFYFAADVQPDCRYFCKLNSPLPDMMETQKRFVSEAMVDYVVTRDCRLEDFFQELPYRLAAEQTDSDSNESFVYRLYEKND